MISGKILSEELYKVCISSLTDKYELDCPNGWDTVIERLKLCDRLEAENKALIDEINYLKSQLKPIAFIPIKIIRETFEEFWKLYPKKIGKQKAEKKFIQICKNEPNLLNDIIKGLIRYLSVFENKKREFIPHPITWLNQGRWEDEILESDIHLF